MYKRIEFIGREKELRTIQSWIDMPKKNIVKKDITKKNTIIFLEADGGIGKTRMLKEIESKYKNSEKVMVSNIIDYDEYRYFSVNTMRNAIITKIGEEYFKKYREDETKNVAKKELLNHQFTIDFNHHERMSSKKFVLLIDTAEKTQNALFWDGFREMLQELENLVVIIAGRSKDHDGEFFNRKEIFFEGKIPEYNLETIELKSFSEKESKSYLDKKREREGIAKISPKLVDCAIRLSKGNPIILDLAIEWILRDYKDNPNKFFSDKLKVDNCSALAQHKPEVLKTKEKLIVTYFEKDDNALKKMIHALLYIPRLKSEMLSYLFGDTISREDFEDLKKYVFIKDAGQGYITLHDEMARLLNEYIRPEIDQKGTLGRDYAQKILPFYEEEIRQLTITLRDVAIRDKFDLRKRLNYNKVEFICNLFIVNDRIDEAMNHLIELLIQARENGTHSLTQYVFRKLKLERMEHKLSLRQLTEFKTLEAKSLSTLGKYQEAKALLLNFASEHDHELDDFNSANLRNMLASAYSKLGELNEAIEAQTFAYERFSGEFKVNSGIHLGIIYREKGQHNNALKYLTAVLDLTKVLPDNKRKALQAEIFYRLANVYRMTGESILAVRYIEEALKIWNIQESKNNMAKAYMMMGNIYRVQDHYDLAEDEYEKAVKIVEDESEVYIDLLINRAWSKIFQGKWDEAKEEIKKVEKSVKKYGYHYEQVHILSLLSTIYEEDGVEEGKKARETLEAYAGLGKAHGNVYYQAEVLLILVKLDYEKKVDNVESKIFEKANTLESYREKYDLPKFFGQMKLYQAKILFDNEKYFDSMNYYQEGFIELSRYEGYLIMDKELKNLIDKLKKFDHDEALNYLRTLENGWDSNSKLSQWCKREIAFLELGA